MAGIDGKTRFLNALREAQEQGRAVAVYAEADDYQAYEVGFVEYADSSEVILQCLTPKGEPDGRRALHTDDVLRVDADNAYIRKLELLYQYRDSVFDKDFRKSGAGQTDLRGQLEHAKANNTMVHLVDSNDYGPSGFVREVGDDYVEIERIGNNGEPDGTSTILVSSIAKVHFGRRQDQVLEFLYRYNYELKRLLES
ncbi:hypothetical protein [Fimbriimonas ginsengisoli]|uniref:Uncharacterized protein n=1 Tax=Fimbriimonas ginsengisoli Gsoil 348 TaxID=661478 RepID=A0A068NVM4_FIMGI|nr:hypothetical protein [Fimbriimonas ginsengisoli]AIE86845.1 hypothetical protein OP10G_3477 [Fimbriimonas ginsengisoli Gsoil 348]